VLTVFPRYAASFGTMDRAFGIAGVKAFMPPQGILVVASYLPEEWCVRVVDENVRPVTDDDLSWAEVVMVTGMHVQRESITALLRRAHAAGDLTVLGGPSVSASPEWYPGAHIIHIGELGDATDDLIARLSAGVTAPLAQERYETCERLPLQAFPVPAYERISITDYLLGSVQYSSGCPYRCEFCDIPELYGKKARMKRPGQLLAELDSMLAGGNPGAVYFVDDNFIANPRAATALLEALISWQRERGYPLEFACEATLNVTGRPKILELMRQARVTTMFCGIKTPEPEALRRMGKTQNLRSPILDAVETLNSYGIEVVSGIILGLDTDTLETYERVLSFIEESAIPMCTVNLLQALPRTPLYRRLEAAGRLLPEGGAGTNVKFLLPEETVLAGWHAVLSAAFSPEALYHRYAKQMSTTYRARMPVPITPARVAPALLARGSVMLMRVLWHVGVRADYRRYFWQLARPALRRGQIQEVIQVATVAHHLIEFAREALRGSAERSFYAPAGRSTSVTPVSPREQSHASAQAQSLWRGRTPSCLSVRAWRQGPTSWLTERVSNIGSKSRR